MSTLRTLLTVVVLAYLFLCTFYYFVQDALIFQGAGAMPLREQLPATPIEIETEDATLRGYLINPSISGVAIFYFGGNAEPVTAYADRFAALPARTYLIDYRGYGRSEGTPSQDALVRDATQRVSEFATVQDRVFFVGRSLGTGVAALAASELGARIAGMVLISPFCSFGNVVALHAPALLPARLLLAHPFEVDSIASRLPRRLTIIVGASDTVIPPAESRCLATTIGGSAETIEIPAAGHNDILHRDVVWQAIARTITSAADERPRRVLL